MTVTPGRLPPTQRSIAPPVADKHPLKVNVFERMQSGNAQLLPLFPYMDAGSMVPAGALLRGGAGVDYGQFFHTNTVDEVIIVFGARGAFLQPGQVYVGARTHSVTSHLKDQSDPEGLLVLVITQRQSPNTSQEEAITFRCQACNEVLLKHDYSAPTVPLTGRPADNHIPIFPTLAGSQQAAEILNEHEANRTCPKCGRINERFPDHLWGWKRYLDQGRTVNEARKELLLAADGGLSG